MSSRVSGAVEERISMLREWDTGAFTVSELCDRYGISRETSYVWKSQREFTHPRPVVRAQ